MTIRLCACRLRVVTVEFGTPWLHGPDRPAVPTLCGNRISGHGDPFQPTHLAQRDGDALSPSRSGTSKSSAWAPLSTPRKQAAAGMRSMARSAVTMIFPRSISMRHSRCTMRCGWPGAMNSVFARHLGSRTIPVIEGDFLLQTGCLPGQCAFAIGMLAVDPAQRGGLFGFPQ
jgi:hypothetical protein